MCYCVNDPNVSRGKQRYSAKKTYFATQIKPFLEKVCSGSGSSSSRQSKTNNEQQTTMCVARLVRGEADGKYVWRGRFARGEAGCGDAGGVWRGRMRRGRMRRCRWTVARPDVAMPDVALPDAAMPVGVAKPLGVVCGEAGSERVTQHDKWRCRMRRCRWAWRSRLELCVARPVPREWPSTTRTMENKRFFTRKQKFRKVSFPEENKSFPPGLSVWRKTNKKLFFKKVCFWKENKRFLKRFVSTRKTNSGPTSLKQKFAGKQTNKTTWKKVCFQGFQTLCGQVCFEFWVFNKLLLKRFVLGPETLVLYWKPLFSWGNVCFLHAAAFPTRASSWKP